MKLAIWRPLSSILASPNDVTPTGLKLQRLIWSMILWEIYVTGHSVTVTRGSPYYVDYDRSYIVTWRKFAELFRQPLSGEVSLQFPAGHYWCLRNGKWPPAGYYEYIDGRYCKWLLKIGELPKEHMLS
jgi:hypothetical protein